MTDKSDLTPISDEDLQKQFRISVGLVAKWIPQLKGPGAIKERLERERALNQFADELLKQLRLGNLKFFQGPPTPHHSQPDYEHNKTVDIPVGLPRHNDLPK